MAPTTGGFTGLDTVVALGSDSTLEADASSEAKCDCVPGTAVVLSGLERGRAGGEGDSDLAGEAGVTRCLPRVCLVGRSTTLSV